MKEQFDAHLKKCPIIAILRGVAPEEIVTVTDVLYEAGVQLLEVPLNSPNACESIAKAAEHCKGRQMVGAGTVLTADEVCDVQKAGGAFIISPNTFGDVIRKAKELGLISIPGIFTATEGFDAMRYGADYLKLFPACLGPGYVKDLKAVIKTPFIAVGGINLENIPAFMKVCVGVGIGSALYKPGKALDQIRADAVKMAAATGA